MVVCSSGVDAKSVHSVRKHEKPFAFKIAGTVKWQAKKRGDPGSEFWASPQKCVVAANWNANTPMHSVAPVVCLWGCRARLAAGGERTWIWDQSHVPGTVLSPNDTD